MSKDYWSLIDKYLSNCSLVVSLLLLLLWAPVYGAPQSDALLSIKKIDQDEQKYTGAIKRRFAAWKKLIQTNQNKSIPEKLKLTNDFFNQFTFTYDSNELQAGDYWQTPEEFIISAEGDCEDFSIAKYFTLLALDVPMSTLRITYVKAIRLNRAHMVLTYYSTPEAEPLILDNLESKILPASKRPDLVPVYSFNGNGLWLAKQRSPDKFLGNSDRLSKWQNLIQRMQKR